MSAFWKVDWRIKSDVEKPYPGSTDMEIIIEELGLYDNVTTRKQRHKSALSENSLESKLQVNSRRSTAVWSFVLYEWKESSCLAFGSNLTVIWHMSPKELCVNFSNTNNYVQQPILILEAEQ